MPNTAYSTFIEDCRQERAHLFGLIEALEGKRMTPGMPLVIPATMADATSATLSAFQNAVFQLNTLIDTYDAELKTEGTPAKAS